MGWLGETIAARFLTDHGLEVVARNVDVGGGEIDLLSLDHGVRVVTEVRAISGEADPIDAIDVLKRRRVRRLGAMIGAGRVDFVGIRLGRDAIVVHWVPGS